MAFDGKQFDRDGFAVIDRVLDSADVVWIRRQLDDALRNRDDEVVRRRGTIYGVRGLLRLVPELRSIDEHPVVRAIVGSVLESPRLVRGILFDKSAETNWAVPWHQDLTVPVVERTDVPGFGQWSTKLGVPHVQPSTEFLREMVTLRLHLDEADSHSGALRVIPGSHTNGKLSPDDRQRWIDGQEWTTCAAPTGGAVLMSPLILHASTRSSSHSRRRVLHLEFAAMDLPDPLRWFEDEPKTADFP